jgi:hypothetical protein
LAGNGGKRSITTLRGGGGILRPEIVITFLPSIILNKLE